MFLVGLIFFSLGIFIVSNASELFTGFTFLTRRVFMSKKKAENYFKTFGEFLEHRTARGIDRREKEVGRVVLYIGIGYLLLTFAMNFII